MSFQTFTADPGFPPANGRLRATIGAWIVDYDPPTAPTLAQVQAQAAPTAAQLVTDVRSQAKALAALAAPAEHLLRAQLLVLMDEFNVIRARIRAMDAAVAGAATLAALKTAWAALAPMPDRTAAQIKPALLARCDTVDAD